jgi:nucleoside phosphorylase
MTTPYAKLSDLLRSMFNTEELRAFLRRLPRGADLADALPEGQGISLLAGHAVDALERRGRVDPEFFAHLVNHTPERYDAIADVARAWNVAPPPRHQAAARFERMVHDGSLPRKEPQYVPIIAVHEHPDFAAELQQIFDAWNDAQDRVEFRGLTLPESVTEQLISPGAISVKDASVLADRLRRGCGLGATDTVILITEKRLHQAPDYFRLFVGGTDENEDPPRTSTISLEFPRFLQHETDHEDDQILFRIVIHNLISIIASDVGLEPHDETRGCLMDFCENMSDVITGLNRGPGFCIQCSRMIDQRRAGFLYQLCAAAIAQLEPNMVAHVEARLRERGRKLHGSQLQKNTKLKAQPSDRAKQHQERADIVILVALVEEFEQLRNLLPLMTPVPDPIHSGYDYYFEYGSADAVYRCVARFVGTMGPDRAGLFTDRMISRWHPAAVIMVGIAAGLHKDIRLGDVVAAQQVNAYLGETKAVSNNMNGWVFQPRPRVFQCDHLLLQEVDHLSFAHSSVYSKWRNDCAADLQTRVGASAREQLVSDRLLGSEPNLLSAHLASGPVVVADNSFADWIRSHDASVKAVDMEAAGLVESAFTRANPPRTLVLRGISDLGDERKSRFDMIDDGGLRRLAMRNATRLLLALMEANVLPRGEEER